MNLNVALISPNKDAYSETFIKAHKELLDGEVYFLYGNTIPTHYKDKDGKEQRLMTTATAKWIGCYLHSFMTDTKKLIRRKRHL